MRTRGKKPSGRESDPNNADPEQVGKVNPNPECKHQITLQHTVYGIRIHSFIGLSLHWNSTKQSRDHLLISMDSEQTPDLLLYVMSFSISNKWSKVFVAWGEFLETLRDFSLMQEESKMTARQRESDEMRK